MSSVVDICNIALSRLGDRATVTSIDPPEGSAQADHCRRFYPIALKTILATYNWSFATTRKELARLTAEPIGGGYAFPIPADCVKIIYAYPVDENGNATRQTLHYVRELINGQVCLLAEQKRIWIRYITTEVKPEKFSDVFADALAFLLASNLAGTVVPGMTGVQMAAEMMRFYEDRLLKAQAQDAVQDRDHLSYKPDFIGDYGDWGRDGHEWLN